MADPLTIGLGILGGLLGGEGQQSGGSTSGTSSSNSSSSGEGFTQNFVDPRFEPYIYGDGGILGSAYNWYNQNRSGTNPQILEGMNNQWAQLGASKQGFDAMQNLGMGLMGQGAAGNPFSGGYQGGGTFPTTGIAPQTLTYNPAQFGQGGPFVQREIPLSSMGGGGGEGGGEQPMGIADILSGFGPIKPPPPGTLDPFLYRGGSRTNEGSGRDPRDGGYGGGYSGHWSEGGPGDGLGW